MRKLTYTLSNGSVVNSFAQAKESGMSYKVTLQNVNPEPMTVSPKRAEMLKKFGRVSKDLRDKV
jgi:hypothetical protein